MKNLETKASPKSKGVVSAKLPDEIKTELTEQAEKEGLTISEVLRRKLTEEKKPSPIEPKQIPQETVPQTNGVSITEISPESLLNVMAVVNEALQSVNENIQNISKPAPEREYLKKIAGQPAENPGTLSQEEENYLQSLTESVKADCIESLLQEYNSVPIEPIFKNELQKRTFKELVSKRNAVSSDKLPSLNTIFMKAIRRAFFEDCKKLYDNRLFQVTYGLTYDELEAVFGED